MILTIAFVMLAEVLIFVPSVARFREDYLINRLERAQIASLALLADDVIEPRLEAELLENAEVFNVVLRRDEASELVLSSPMPRMVDQSYDLRTQTPYTLIRDAMLRLINPENQMIRIIGQPVREGGLVIEITMESASLRQAMLDYGRNILILSAVISVFTASLLFFAVRRLMVLPIRNVVGHMKSYAQAPEDARRIISPSASVIELRQAEDALHDLQTELTGALKQKERLAQLGGAVARISHDLRNILTTAQLFADRMEMSDDPAVKRAAPKLVGSISRAVNLCESTLTFGKAEEPAPALTHVLLADVVAEVFDNERLAAGAHDISYGGDIPTALSLRADPEQLYRILLNLVRNARQALVAKGGVGEISVQAEEGATDWSIKISDTGPGLPKRAQEMLFQPFAGTSRKGGTGLGLAIAAELVRGHGGRLELERTGPEGTVFAVYLPRGLSAVE